VTPCAAGPATPPPPQHHLAPLVSTSGQVTLGPTEVVARIAERTYSPVLRSADLPEVEVPWWGGRRLRFEIAVGKT
jgi:hypothetical protein